MTRMLGFTLVHAGLPPQWDLAEPRRRRRPSSRPCSAATVSWISCRQMYGNLPISGRRARGTDRLRYIVNAFTRMRYCRPDGSLELEEKCAPEHAPPGLMPWFRFPGRRSAGLRLVFGHWSTLGDLSEQGAYGLDTGCVWGGRLTALRLDDADAHCVECGPGLLPAARRLESAQRRETSVMQLSLDGRRAVVCGASRGIGRRDRDGTGRHGRRPGAGGARRHAGLGRKQAARRSEPARGLRRGLLRQPAVETAFTAIAAQGPVHVLVNNTGGPAAGTVFEARPAEFVDAFRQHLVAARSPCSRWCRACARPATAGSSISSRPR
jgi:diadenosine tetraphosphatase ApaH/serine/threonine PP2A family protein phosphatase